MIQDHSLIYSVYPLRWYCAVTLEGVEEMTTSLTEAQSRLQGDDRFQAIIPMLGDDPQHPKGLVDDKWPGGSAKWRDEDQLQGCRNKERCFF